MCVCVFAHPFIDDANKGNERFKKKKTLNRVLVTMKERIIGLKKEKKESPGNEWAQRYTFHSI